MTAELRSFLKADQDRRARRALRSEPRHGTARHGITECSKCACHVHDWTLGCSTCRERHRAYHKRMFYPHGEAWYETRKGEHTAYHYAQRRENGRATYA